MSSLWRFLKFHHVNFTPLSGFTHWILYIPLLKLMQWHVFKFFHVPKIHSYKQQGKEDIKTFKNQQSTSVDQLEQRPAWNNTGMVGLKKISSGYLLSSLRAGLLHNLVFLGPSTVLGIWLINKCFMNKWMRYQEKLFINSGVVWIPVKCE